MVARGRSPFWYNGKASASVGTGPGWIPALWPSCTCCGAQTMTISCAANISQGRSVIQPQSSSWGHNCPSLPLIKGKTQVKCGWCHQLGNLGGSPRTMSGPFQFITSAKFSPQQWFWPFQNCQPQIDLGAFAFCCLSCLSTEISGPQDPQANLGPTPSRYLMAGSYRESTGTHSAVACSEKVQQASALSGA